MTTPHWTADPILAAAVERLRDLLTERACFAAHMEVTTHSPPTLSVSGNGRGEGPPRNRTEDGRRAWWVVVGADGIEASLSSPVEREPTTEEQLAAALLRARRAEENLAALQAGLHAPIGAAPDTDTVRLPAVQS